MAIRRTPKVFNSSYRPPRPDTRQQYRSLKPLLVVFAVVVVILLLSRLPIFTIQHVMVEGTTNQTVINYLEKLNGQSIFSRLIGSTVNQIRANHLDINTIECKRGLPDTIRCQVLLRTPAIVWHHNNQRWLVDEQGYVYGPAGAEEGLLLVEDRGPTGVAIGQIVASEEIVSQYQQLITDLRTDGYAVTTIFVTESLQQPSIIMTGNESPGFDWSPSAPITVLFVTTYSLESQRQALKEIIAQKKSSITERIDLRVPGYAYTK